jgi:hypothetical protein|tara:strand:- start:4177 stop:4425 length:249 start_codon:yes stop_codon:yes gene_type:complete
MFEEEEVLFSVVEPTQDQQIVGLTMALFVINEVKARLIQGVNDAEPESEIYYDFLSQLLVTVETQQMYEENISYLSGGTEYQ